MVSFQKNLNNYRSSKGYNQPVIADYFRQTGTCPPAIGLQARYQHQRMPYKSLGCSS